MEVRIRGQKVPPEWVSEEACPRCGAVAGKFNGEAIWGAVREQLEVMGKNQAWLADGLGVSEGYVTQLKNGDKPWTASLLTKAVNLLGM